ncbi:hypothetical protein B9Z35_01645 [Limnohabitans sp. Jir61]|uniref:hypothetical protein n=1 Tax=Limnohabitans sp. Jir61 TaxID=1826168 RepID=UPI000D384A7D|nr:hypothetical protein [Limnohabitans sp. Jir61]PUE32277.1 hypothetical protein B9Z35_01645 [Limnohabitans sp. Jir61]
MRFIEFETNTNEGRQWTANDETQQIVQQMDRQDNIRALNVYFQDVHITNAVKVLASRPDCKWFFNLMALKLHQLDADGVSGVYFCMHKHGDDWHIWSLDDDDHGIAYEQGAKGTFPLLAIALRAVNEANFWHVSLAEYEI